MAAPSQNAIDLTAFDLVPFVIDLCAAIEESDTSTPAQRAVRFALDRASGPCAQAERLFAKLQTCRDLLATLPGVEIHEDEQARILQELERVRDKKRLVWRVRVYLSAIQSDCREVSIDRREEGIVELEDWDT